MKIPKVVMNLVWIFLIPSIFVYPLTGREIETSNRATNSIENPNYDPFANRGLPFTYAEFLSMVDDWENLEDLESIYPEEKIKEIQKWFMYFAELGGATDFEEEDAELPCNDWSYQSPNFDRGEAIVFDQGFDQNSIKLRLCRTWYSCTWRWIKKHKKLVIGIAAMVAGGYIAYDAYSSSDKTSENSDGPKPLPEDEILTRRFNSPPQNQNATPIALDYTQTGKMLKNASSQEESQEEFQPSDAYIEYLLDRSSIGKIPVEINSNFIEGINSYSKEELENQFEEIFKNSNNLSLSEKAIKYSSFVAHETIDAIEEIFFSQNEINEPKSIRNGIIQDEFLYPRGDINNESEEFNPFIDHDRVNRSQKMGMGYSSEQASTEQKVLRKDLSQKETFQSAHEKVDELIGPTQIQDAPITKSKITSAIAKGIVQGIYDSGKSSIDLIIELGSHPIQTATQMYSALSTLAQLAKEDEWEVIGEALSPEIHQLVVEWNTLPTDKKINLASYAAGKHGTDFLGINAITKSAKALKEVSAIAKKIKHVEKVVALEAAGAGGLNVRIPVAIEELSSKTKELKQIQKVGEVEAVIKEASKQSTLQIKDLPKQIHHFATDKHKIFTPRMNEIAKQFNLELNGSWNKELMHHLGRHPKEYHDFVLFEMEKAARIAKNDQKLFLELFEKNIKKPIMDNPELLRKSGWR